MTSRCVPLCACPERCADGLVQDLVEDYVERNQDDFDEFADVAEMYESLNLEALLEKSAALCVPHTFRAQHARSANVHRRNVQAGGRDRRRAEAKRPGLGRQLQQRRLRLRTRR